MSTLQKSLLWITFTETVGLSSGWVTRDAIKTWYVFLEKPIWTPPNLVFPIVWTILYALMGLSAAWVAQASQKEKLNLLAYLKQPALKWFWIQLALNASWSFIFFGWHHIFLALCVISVLWISIVKMICQFRQIHPVAAYLQIPYLLWVTYAVGLNAVIYVANPQ
jgi:translocator protein